MVTLNKAFIIFYLFFITPTFAFSGEISSPPTQPCQFWLQSVFYVVAIIGVFLGIFYFFARIRFEKEMDKKARERRRMEQILKYLNEYDDYVCTILHLSIDENGLPMLREKIINSFTLIQNYLECEKLHSFSEQDLKELMNFHSYVDNHPLISRSAFKDLNKGALLACIPEYREKINQARFVCIKKME